MKLKEVLNLIYPDQKVRFRDGGEDIVYEGEAISTPYWVADAALYDESIMITEDGYIEAYLKFVEL